MTKTEPIDDNDKPKINVNQSIIKDFGDGVLKTGNAIIDEEVMVVPVSPQLDTILGGGIPEGSLVTLTGQPKCGKTLSSLAFAAACQREEYGNRTIVFLNVEGRLRKRDIQGIDGLNPDKFHIIGSSRGNILNAEQYLTIAERYINNVPQCVVIIDSYSALCTDAEFTSDLNKMQRADGAKLLAKFCRKISNIVPVNKNIVIGITHLMGNPTGYGAAFKEKSGQAIAYQVDVKLRAKTFAPWKIGEIQVGQTVDWLCVTSPLCAPGQTTTSYIRYGHGIDKMYELINLAVDLGIIHKGGAWLTLQIGDETAKIQGVEKMRTLLTNKPDIYKQLQQGVNTLLGTP